MGSILLSILLFGLRISIAIQHEDASSLLATFQTAMRIKFLCPNIKNLIRIISFCCVVSYFYSFVFIFPNNTVFIIISTSNCVTEHPNTLSNNRITNTKSLATPLNGKTILRVALGALNRPTTIECTCVQPSHANLSKFCDIASSDRFSTVSLS